MPRSYIACVELEYIVVAESPESAKKLALAAAQNDHLDTEDFSLSDCKHLPAMYRDQTDLVENDQNRDVTVDEALRLPGGYKYEAAKNG